MGPARGLPGDHGRDRSRVADQDHLRRQENGKPVLGSAQVKDPAFADGVVAETRTLLTTVPNAVMAPVSPWLPGHPRESERLSPSAWPPAAMTSIAVGRRKDRLTALAASLTCGAATCRLP